MKQYSEYKDSGVEWIGAIPKEWSRTKLKNLLSIPITDGPHETPEILDEGVPFISAEAVKNLKLDFNLKRGYITREEHERFCKKCKPQYGDIFMVKSGATTGTIAMVETSEEFSIWSPLALIRSNPQIIDNRFLFYFLQSRVFRLQVELFWSYGTQQNIGMGVLGNLFISYPDLFIQQAIAEYLDRKTATIDSLIADKQKLIDLLKEKRQAVISEVVTKGLDKNAKMKDSGIEWIGEMPESWSVKKLKFTVELVNVKGNFSEQVYIGLENIESNTGRYIFTENNEIDGISNAFKIGDILFGKLRPYLAKCIIADFDGICSSELLVFRNFVGDKRYLYRLLLSSSFLEEVNSSTYGSKMPRASWDFIGQIFIPMPNLEEQQSIADYIDIKTSKIDSLITDITGQIEKFKEYRQSIINEAVTGKVAI